MSIKRFLLLLFIMAAWSQTGIAAQVFDPYAAASAAAGTMTSAYNGTTLRAGMAGYSNSSTINQTMTQTINSGSNLGTLQSNGMTTYATNTTIGKIINNQLNNPIKIPTNSPYVAQSLSLATSTTNSTNYLSSQGVSLLQATSNATQFTVFSGGGIPGTVCTQTGNITNSVTCNINTTYNYNTCNISPGTAVAVPCVPAPASATTWAIVGTNAAGTAVSVQVSIASQCPASFSMTTYSGIFSMVASDNASPANTAFFTISTANSTVATLAFTLNLAIGTDNYTYTGGCTGPIGGVQSCNYQFTDTATGVALSPLVFTYTPDSGVFQANLTDTCTPWEASAATPPAVCSPSTPCCSLSTSACTNSTPIVINGVTILPPGGCWNTQDTFSCNVGTNNAACNTLSSQGYTQTASACINLDQYGNCTDQQLTMSQSTTTCLQNSTTVTGGGAGTVPITVCDKSSATTNNTTCNNVYSYTYPTCDIYQGTIVSTACIAAPAWSTPGINDGAGSFSFSFPSQCPQGYFTGSTYFNGGYVWGAALSIYPVPDSSPIMLGSSWYPPTPFYYYVWYSGGCTGVPGALQTCTYKFWTSNDSGKYKYSLAYTATVYYTSANAYVQNTVNNTCAALTTNSSCHYSSQYCANPYWQYVNGFWLAPPNGCWDIREIYTCGNGVSITACDTLTAAGYTTMSAGKCISTDAYGNCLTMQYQMQKVSTICTASHTINMATLTIQGGCSSSSTGNCVSQPPPPSGNGSLNKTITQLSAAFALKSSFNGSPPMFFTGTPMQCGSSGVYNCCSNSPSIINPQCNTMEQQLSSYRSAGECTFAGGYCSYSVDPCQPFGSCAICLQNTDVYCCFSSQLADLIQNGAHSQLGIPWTTGALPGGANCGPISPSQLMSLNFSLIDFSPIFGQVQVNMQTAVSAITNSLATISTQAPMTTNMCPTCPP